jgi:predicted deacylase
MTPYELTPPALGDWRRGNTGVEGVWRFESSRAGREVMVSAIVHGNELCGAWALLAALQAQLRPRCGALTLAFCNLDAFDRFDPQNPDAARYVEHDLNRLWGARAGAAASCLEHRRVQALQPFVERADWLLDLHSMHAPGPPLGLSGPLAHHARQAAALGAPALLVADAGHAAGVRMRDHGRFSDAGDAKAFALLVECGWHGATASRTVALDVMHRFLLASGVVDAADLPRAWRQPDGPAPQLLEVTQAVTVAEGEPPSFARAWSSGDVIERAGTLIGRNGGQPVLTPYDHCVLVMPSPTLSHAQSGATLVRLARRVALRR